MELLLKEQGDNVRHAGEQRVFAQMIHLSVVYERRVKH